LLDGMELRHLRYFVAVAEAQNLSLAAQRLVITQSALRRQLHVLQDKLGISLWRHFSSRIALTAAGQVFYHRAREVLAAAEAAVGEARSVAHATVNRVRFGQYGALWIDYYATALRRFARQFPGVQLEYVDAKPAELIAALECGTIDIALLNAAALAVPGVWAHRRLATFPAFLAMGTGNPLAKRRSYALAELREATWVTWDERAFPGRKDLLLEAAQRAGFEPRIQCEVDSVAALIGQVTTSDAIGYVLPLTRKLPHAGVAFAALHPAAINFELAVAWRSEADHADRLEVLAELLAATPPAKGRQA
jgi:DNA-binding transcriptional LysR family regulator